MTIFTGVIMAATAVQGISSYYQWGVAVDTLNATRRSIEIAQRPWVGILSREIEVKTPLSFGFGLANVEIGYTLKNTGNSPALETTSVLALYVEPARKDTVVGFEHITNRLRECKQGTFGREHPLQMAKVGYVVLNGDAVTPSPTTIQKRIEARDSDVEVWLSVCTLYRDQFGEPHATGQLWRYIAADGRQTFKPFGEVRGTFRGTGFSTAH